MIFIELIFILVIFILPIMLLALLLAYQNNRMRGQTPKQSLKNLFAELFGVSRN